MHASREKFILIYSNILPHIQFRIIDGKEIKLNETEMYERYLYNIVDHR